MKNVVAVKKAAFTHNSIKFVVIMTDAGQVEIYSVDAEDGIEMFCGYIQDTRINANVKFAAMSALYTPAAIVWSIPTQLSFPSIYFQEAK